MKLILARELLNGTPRGPISDGKKRRIWEAHEGICPICGESVPMFGREVIYDHEIPLALNGPDTEANMAPIHASPCNKIKTKRDIAMIVKAKRQRKMVEELEPSKRPIPQRKDPWPTGRKLESRPFFGGRKPA